jgi:hypothetical protein
MVGAVIAWSVADSNILLSARRLLSRKNSQTPALYGKIGTAPLGASYDLQNRFLRKKGACI